MKFSIIWIHGHYFFNEYSQAFERKRILTHYDYAVVSVRENVGVKTHSE